MPRSGGGLGKKKKKKKEAFRKGSGFSEAPRRIPVAGLSTGAASPLQQRPANRRSQRRRAPEPGSARRRPGARGDPRGARPAGRESGQSGPGAARGWAQGLPTRSWGWAEDGTPELWLNGPRAAPCLPGGYQSAIRHRNSCWCRIVLLPAGSQRPAGTGWPLIQHALTRRGYGTAEQTSWGSA